MEPVSEAAQAFIDAFKALPYEQQSYIRSKMLEKERKIGQRHVQNIIEFLTSY